MTILVKIASTMMLGGAFSFFWIWAEAKSGKRAPDWISGVQGLLYILGVIGALIFALANIWG